MNFSLESSPSPFGRGSERGLVRVKLRLWQEETDDESQ